MLLKLRDLFFQRGRASLWRTSFHTIGLNVYSMGLGILTSVILARLLGPEGKGSYDLVVVTASLFVTVANLSLPVGITYTVARQQVAPGSLLLRLLGVALLQALVSAVALTLLWRSPFAQAFLPKDAGVIGMVIALLYIFLMILYSYVSSVLIGRQDILLSNQGTLVGKTVPFLILTAAFLYGFVTKTAFGYPFFLWVLIVQFPVSLVYFLKVLPLSSGDSGLKAIFMFALPCYAGNLVQFLNYRLDVFFVSFYHGAADVGLYTLAVSFAQMIWLISNSFASVVLPRVASSGETGAEHACDVAKANRIVLWISAALGAGVVVLAALLFPVVFGRAFGASVAPLLVLMPGTVIFSVVNILASYIAGTGKPSVNLNIALVGLVITVAMNVLLVPRYSYMGGALATTFSYLASAVLTAAYFIRTSAVTAREVLLPTRADATEVLARVRSQLGKGA